MESETNLVDFENLLILKNQLITLSTKTLCELYSDMDIYTKFIDSVVHMINEESAFLYISDTFVEKIQSVIQVHRFDIKDKETINTINDIISCLNEISNTSVDMKRMMISGYIAYHKDIRNVEFDKVDDFLSSLTYDPVVYLNLKEEEAVTLSVSDDLTLSSINYFLNMIPDFFKDPSVRLNTENTLDIIYKRSKAFDFARKILSTKAKKKVKEIKIEE